MDNIIKEKLLTSNLSEMERKQLSEQILLSKDLELNYYAIKHSTINKINHLQVIIESKDPIFNYRCIKYIMKTNEFTKEEKRILIAFHSQIILQSNNQKLINELSRFLKYNKIEKEYKPIGINYRKKRKKTK